MDVEQENHWHRRADAFPGPMFVQKNLLLWQLITFQLESDEDPSTISVRRATTDDVLESMTLPAWQGPVTSHPYES